MKILTPGRMSFEAATAKSTIGELRSQIEELCSLDIQTQSDLKKTRVELQSTAARLNAATQSSASQVQELSNRVVTLEAQLQSVRQESEAAGAACAAMQADRNERDKVLRELVDENDGLQARLQELQEAGARQEAASAAQLQVQQDAAQLHPELGS